MSKPLVFRTSDMWGNDIHCTQDNWETHIIVEHPEMQGREGDVQRAIEDPDRVSPSTKTGMAFGMEKDAASDTVRAITYYDDPSLREAGATTGRVGTAYIVDTQTYSSRVGSPIYVKTTVQPPSVPVPAPNSPTPASDSKKGE